MVIQNTETSLAKAFGVSGTMSPRLGIKPISPLTMIFRRNFEPADGLLSAVTVQAGQALGVRQIIAFEGQWVTLDASGKAIIATAANTPNGQAWPLFTGGDRLDPNGGVTVLHGPWIADTSFFDKNSTFAAGDFLSIDSGTVNINGVDTAVEGTLKPVTVSAVADLAKVVARVERAPIGVAPETPDGVMRIHSVNS